MFDLDRGSHVWQVEGSGDPEVWFGPDGSLYTAADSTTTDVIRVRSPENGSVQYTLESTSPNTSVSIPAALVFNGTHLFTVVRSVDGRQLVVTDWPLRDG